MGEGILSFCKREISILQPYSPDLKNLLSDNLASYPELSWCVCVWGGGEFLTIHQWDKTGKFKSLLMGKKFAWRLVSCFF